MRGRGGCGLFEWIAEWLEWCSSCVWRVVQSMKVMEPWGRGGKIKRLPNTIMGITGYLGVRFIKFSFAVFLHIRTSPINRTRNCTSHHPLITHYICTRCSLTACSILPLSHHTILPHSNLTISQSLALSNFSPNLQPVFTRQSFSSPTHLPFFTHCPNL